MGWGGGTGALGVTRVLAGSTAPNCRRADSARNWSRIDGFGGSVARVGLIPHRERPGEAIRAALQSLAMVGTYLSTGALLGAL